MIFLAKYETQIATTNYFLNAERVPVSLDGKGIRLAEQNMGNLITDALRYDPGEYKAEPEARTTVASLLSS